MPPPPLMAELVEEILLRFPPQEPASLVRAAVVSKQWCCLFSGRGFRRRFREFHRTPPLLGFLLSDLDAPTRFVLTIPFRSPFAERDDWIVLDARHGRVLLRENKEVGVDAIVIWDPITDERKELPVPSEYTSWPPQREVSLAASFLCIAGGGTCDHLDCHRGPFLVILVSSDIWDTFVCTYSSDVDAWSEIVSSATRNPHLFFADPRCTVRVGNDLYFGCQVTDIILKYNLESCGMSWIQIPDECSKSQCYVLTNMEEARLGLVTIIGSKLNVWLRKDGHEVDAGWARTRVIELKTLLPFGNVVTLPCVVGFADGLDIVFLKSSDLLYTIDLKTYNVKKLCQTQLPPGHGTSVVPYKSFYTPALEAACSGEEPSAGGSSA